MLNEIEKELIESPATIIEDAGTAESAAEEIFEVVKAVKDAKYDGSISFSEMKDIAGELVDAAAKTVTEYSSGRQGAAELVVKIVKDLYYSPEGLNNPDISWIPDGLEDRLEDVFFDFVLPVAAKAATTFFRI